MKKLLLLIILSFIGFNNLSANAPSTYVISTGELKQAYSTKFNNFLNDFIQQGGSLETAEILRETFVELYAENNQNQPSSQAPNQSSSLIPNSNSNSTLSLNKLKLKFLPVFFSLKTADQKILWNMYLNKKPQINKQIELHKNLKP